MRTLLLVCFVAFACAEYLNTPHHRVHHSCVHGVESHSSIHTDERGNFVVTKPDGEKINYPPCPYPPENRMHGVAWKAWTQYHNTTGFDFMSANWPVPPAPPVPSNSEILYYWPGTEPDDNSFVLQPVLQYGSTPAGGGKYWAVASWYVGRRAFFTPLVTASTGDIMFGTMTANANSSWTIVSENANTQQSVSLLANNIVTQTFAYCVLEAYNIDNCTAQYPESFTTETFTNIVTNIKGAASTPQWVPLIKAPRLCNERAKVQSTSSVSIIWSE